MFHTQSITATVQGLSGLMWLVATKLNSTASEGRAGEGRRERIEKAGSILAGDPKQLLKSNMAVSLLDDFESGY